MKRHLLLSLFFIGTMCSCVQKETTKLQSIHFPRASGKSLSDQMNVDRLIRLETNEECLIGDIADVQCVGDDIYILDFRYAKSVFHFDRSGKFIKKISSVGNGPEEYVLPISFAIDSDNDKIYLIDGATGNILTYNLSTFEFIQKRSISGISLFYHKESFYLYDPMSEVIDSKPQPFYVHSYDTSLVYKGSCVPLEFETGYVMGPKRRFSVYEDRLRFIPPFSNQVIEIDNHTSTPIYTFEFAQGEIPPLDFLTARKDNLPSELMKGNFVNYFNFTESSLSLFVPYSTNQETFVGIYDKSKGTSQSFTLSDKNSWISAFSPIASINDQVVFCSFGDEIYCYSNLCPESLQQIINERSEGDNPIIMIASIKPL